MKIGIYIETLKAKEKTGISRYVKGLLNALATVDSDNEYYLYYHSSLTSKPKIDLDFSKANFHLRPIMFPSSWFDAYPRIWWSYYLPLFLNIDGIDIFHGPNHFLPLKGKFKKVVTIHDLAYCFMTVHGPGMDQIMTSWTKKSFEVADAVLAISDSTAKDCIDQGASLPTVHTIYQGFESKDNYNFSPEEIESSLDQLTQGTPYLLFLGSLQPRKNLTTLLKAYSRVEKKIPHKLIFAGPKSSSYNELKQIVEENNLEDRVTFTGYITDLQRVALYSKATAFLYPSLYEGFGLVLLEAMSYGIPTLTSDRSCLPEVVADAGLIVPAEDIDSMANAIYEISTNEQLRNKLKSNGYKRCQQFTWNKAGKEIIEIYNKVYNT